MTEYIKNPLSGKLRGVTYEDGKIIDVHIRDTDDVVKVFVPVRHGRWIYNAESGECVCSACGENALSFRKDTLYGVDLYETCLTDYCPNCGADMRGSNDE